VELHVGVDPMTARSQLLALRGIGPWTADYVVMRGLGHPDVFLANDLGVRHALDRLGSNADQPSLGALAFVRRASPVGEPHRAHVDHPIRNQHR
jgi:3-methyladenine DNA glycosylase/8-oxoguanine DNA glycosylase